MMKITDLTNWHLLCLCCIQENPHARLPDASKKSFNLPNPGGVKRDLMVCGLLNNDGTLTRLGEAVSDHWSERELRIKEEK